MNEGFIYLHRKIKDWEWYDDPIIFKLFIHLLLHANWQAKKWRGLAIQRGELVTSFSQLTSQLTGKQQTRISVQQIRTAINKLKSTGEITIKTTNKYSLIKVNNYDDYQCDNKHSNSPATNKQQTNNKQLTTTNKDNKDNKDNNILSANADEEYSFDKQIKKMFFDKDRRMAIIAYYWTIKKISYQNKETYQAGLKRELRPASLLTGYTNEQIKKTCQWLQDNADFDWSLETVNKYIDEIEMLL